MEVEAETSNKMLPRLITESKGTQPILGLIWLDKLEIGLQGNERTNICRNVNNDEIREKIFADFEAFFETNHTTKDLTLDIQLKKTKHQYNKKEDLCLSFFKARYSKNWRN